MYRISLFGTSHSEEACNDALAPLIKDSKKYLYGKGFTEIEIQEMLKENDADESELVPFVLALAEKEANQNMDPESGILTRSVDWGKAGDCALQALGLDIFQAALQSGVKTWGKAALKKAFKAAAKRALGPVGALIAVVEFSNCYW